MTDANTTLSESIVRVGDGRGFVVEGRRGRYVITAAHCLPGLPAAHPMRSASECNWPLLAPLGERPTIWTECVFVDPMADLAVLGEPCEEFWEAYDTFVDERSPLPVGPLRRGRTPGLLWSLGGQLETCTLLGGETDEEFAAKVAEFGGLAIRQPPLLAVSLEDVVRDAYASGTSGSPIMTAEGVAVAVMSTGRINPVLATTLPVWLAELLVAAQTPPGDGPEEMAR